MRVKLPTKLVSVTTTCVLASSVLALNLPVAAAAEQSEAQTPKPKNIIVMIGDGMGYNHIDATSLYENGTTNHQVSVDPQTGEIEHLPKEPSQIFETWPVQVAMSTYSLSGRKEYDPAKAWSDFKWVYDGPTDSAASGTALATGVKTLNGILGIDGDGNRVQNVAERAAEIGKSTGVVTSVQFSHATPAAWGAHSASRNDLHGITQEMLDGPLDVIIGAGHPLFNDDHQPLSTPRYDYMSQAQWQAVSNGESGFTFVEEKADFEKIAAGQDVPSKLFGLAQVGSTLQQGRSGDFEGALPGEVPFNDVPDLSTLTQAALNTLSVDKDGLFLMVEGGAIDWTGHTNQSTRNIEETQDFFKSVETVVNWVETESSWDETLVIVTADHETGYLDGKDSDPTWKPLTGEKGQLPNSSWNSGNHTNQLVGAFAKGVGSELFASYATKTDPVRGAYLDNTDVAKVAFEVWKDETNVIQDGGIDINVDIDKEATSSGELVLTIPNANQGVTLNDGIDRGDRLIFSGNLPEIIVSDSRSTELVGNGGWSASAKAETFKYLNPSSTFGYVSVIDGKIINSNPCVANAPVKTDVATVFYKENPNWKEHYFHFQIGNESWTKAPGLKMETACEGYLSIEIPLNGAKTVTGVFNNGEGAWDNNSSQNYALPGINDITADHLTWEPKLLSGKNGIEIGGANVGALDGGRGLAQPSSLAKALGDTRLGTTKLSAKLNLETPVDSVNGEYRSKITVTVFPID